jgi:hypothetical protein
MKGSMQSGLRFPCDGDAEAAAAGLIPAASGSPTTSADGHLEHVTPMTYLLLLLLLLISVRRDAHEPEGDEQVQKAVKLRTCDQAVTAEPR